MKKIIAVLLAILLIASIIPVSALDTEEETNEVQEIVEISENEEVEEEIEIQENETTNNDEEILSNSEKDTLVEIGAEPAEASNVAKITIKDQGKTIAVKEVEVGQTINVKYCMNVGNVTDGNTYEEEPSDGYIATIDGGIYFDKTALTSSYSDKKKGKTFPIISNILLSGISSTDSGIEYHINPTEWSWEGCFDADDCQLFDITFTVLQAGDTTIESNINSLQPLTDDKTKYLAKDGDVISQWKKIITIDGAAPVVPTEEPTKPTESTEPELEELYFSNGTMISPTKFYEGSSSSLSVYVFTKNGDVPVKGVTVNASCQKTGGNPVAIMTNKTTTQAGAARVVFGNNLPSGSYVATITASKDGYETATKTIDFQVIKQYYDTRFVVISEPKDVFVGEPNSVTLQLLDEDDNPVSNVNIIPQTKYVPQQKTGTDGKVTFDLSALPAGDYGIIFYAEGKTEGGVTYQPCSSGSINFKVSDKKDATLTLTKPLSVNTIYKPDDTVTYTISYYYQKDTTSLKEEIDGATFKIYKSDDTLIKTTTDKTFTISAADYAVGTENFYVSTDGTDTYKGAKTTPSLLTAIEIAKQQTSFDGKTEGDGELTIEPSTSFLGAHDTISIKGTLKTKKSDSFVPIGAGKNVGVFVEGFGKLDTVSTDKNGQISCTFDSYNLSTVGEYKVYATFEGDANYAPASNQAIGKITIKAATVSGKMDDTDSLKYKNSYLANAQVDLDFEGFQNKDSEITYSIEGTAVSGTATLTNEDTFTIDLTSLAADDYTLTINVNDNIGSKKVPYTCEIKFTIKKAKTTLVANVTYMGPNGEDAAEARYHMDFVIVNYTLTDEYDNTIEGATLSFEVQNQDSAIVDSGDVVTASSGEIQVVYPDVPYKPDTYDGVVSFAGNNNYLADETDYDFTVIKQKSTTTLVIDSTTAKIDKDNVKFIATVIGEDGKALDIVPMETQLASTSGEESVYGTISLTANGTEVAKGNADTSEFTKEYKPITWPVGKYTTVAAFSGNDYYEASEDSQSNEVIKQEQQVTITVKEDGDDIVVDVKVTDENGKPLDGIEVNLTISGKDFGILTTGSAGDASLRIPKKDLPEGEIIIDAVTKESKAYNPNSAEIKYNNRPTSKKTDEKQNGTPIQTGSQNALALFFFLALAAALVVAIQKKRSMDNK